MNVIVWSKDDCGYCVMAKNLLKQKGYEYEERNISGGSWSKDDLLKEVPSARTLPQILIDGVLVGGYTELREKFK